MEEKRKRKAQRQVIWVILLIMALMLYAKVFYNPKVPPSEAENGSEEEKNEKKDGETVLMNLSEYKAGDVVAEEQVDFAHVTQYFTSSELSEEQKEQMLGKSYRENADVSIEGLRYVKVLHYNFEHNIQVGELVVNERIAEDCISIFRELFLGEYEIASMYLVDRYFDQESDEPRGTALSEEAAEARCAAADCASMAANNSSAFHYRRIAGTKTLSNHAYGMAIDINPAQNPYISFNAQAGYQNSYSYDPVFADRSSGAPHMITHDDLCYQIFARYGFSWGGDWESSKDYQHFEKQQGF